MPHKVKCPVCGVYFIREDTDCLKDKNRWWHKECYEKDQQAKAEENKKKELAKEAKNADRKMLNDYICQLFNLEKPSVKIAKQINQLKSKYDFSYSGILKTLKYFYEVKKNPIDKSNNGIMIVPWVYEEAKKYYFNIYKAQIANKAVVINNIDKQNKYKISTPKVKTRIQFVDLDNIIEEEDNK